MLEQSVYIIQGILNHKYQILNLKLNLISSNSSINSLAVSKLLKQKAHGTLGRVHYVTLTSGNQLRVWWALHPGPNALLEHSREICNGRTQHNTPANHDRI